MNRPTLLVLAAAALLGLLLLLRRRSGRRPPEERKPVQPPALPEAPATVESPRAAEETPVTTEAAAELPVAPEPVAPVAPPESSPAACATRLHRLEERLRARLDGAIADGDDPQRDRLQRALVLLNDRLVHLADSCAEEADGRIQALALLDELAGDGADNTAAAAARALRADDPGPAEELLSTLSEGSDATAGRAAYLGGRLADCRVDLDRALALYRRAVELEPDNPAVLLAAGRTARSLYQYREATGWLEHRVHLCAGHGADDPVALALAQRELAYTCVLGGRQRQAGPLYKESMTALARHLGQDHVEMAVSWQQIAELQEMQGEYDKAATLYRKALAILERQRGPEDPSLLPLLDRLAALCVELEMEEEAVTLYEQLVRIRERILRPDHPQLALCLNNLAEACRLLGRYAEADASYRRSLAVNEAVHGPDHPAVAAVLQELAKLSASQGRSEEAERLRERADTIFRRSVEAAERHTGQESLTLDL